MKIPTRNGKHWPTLATSAALHGVLLVGIVALPDWSGDEDGDREPIDIVFYPPTRETPPMAPQEPDVPQPEPVEIAEALPPRVEPPPVERNVAPPPVARNEPPPKPHATPKRRPVPAPRPKPQVRTDLLADADVRRRPDKPVRQTRTGGFTETARAMTEPTRSRRTVSDVGGFETNAVSQQAEPARTRAVAAGSFAGGEVTLPRQGRTRQPRVQAAAFDSGAVQAAAATSRPSRSVTSTGFEQAVLERPASGSARGAVLQGGFGDGERKARTTKRTRPSEDLDSPVEIVSKARPEYTAEARELRIEGEVVLEVTFFASGNIRVLRVVGGLGHGLDEAAKTAAEKIKFTPARRDGEPVDHTATLRVVFRLA